MERIFECRISQQIDIYDMRVGFMKGKGTTHAIFVVRQIRRRLQLKERSSNLALCIWKKSF